MNSPYKVIRAAERVAQKPARVITGRSRKSSVVTIRDACIYLIHEMTTMSSGEISTLFNRHGSAIRYSISRSRDRMHLCDKFRSAYDSIKAEL